VDLREALQQAEAVNLDLVEIAPNAEPPVCRIMDYGKYQFEVNKKKTVQKKKQRAQTKEIKLRPGTDLNDYQVKLRSITRFLLDGDKVKVTVRFRGRELMHPELGMALLTRVEQNIGEQGVVEHPPKLEGKQIVMVISPRKQ
jgi:translation initiation factor IF-3